MTISRTAALQPKNWLGILTGLMILTLPAGHLFGDQANGTAIQDKASKTSDSAASDKQADSAEGDESEEDAPITRMSPEVLWKLGRVGNATLSSDGKQFAYTVRRYELEENKGSTTVYIQGADEKEGRAVLTDWASVGGLQFADSPFGERLYFTGKPQTEDENVKTQAFAMNPADGAMLQITDVEDGIANLKVASNGSRIAFTVDIKLDDEVNELYEDLPKADARVVEGLMYRHWNAWHDYKYSHLHVAKIEESGRAGEAVDLMKDRKVDCPVPPFGGSEQFNWAPDGSEIAYTLKDVEDWAESTNSDVYVTSMDDMENATNITKEMPGYDNDPVYSNDGKSIAFHSMERPSFEADRNRIMIYDRATKEISELTKGLDQTAHGATWLADDSGIVFMSERRGTNQLFKATIGKEGAEQITKGQYNFGLAGIAPDGKTAVISVTNMIRPAELAKLDLSDASFENLTDVNADIYKDLELPTVEERWVTATDGKKIHCWVILPPNFDKSKKYPMLTYCQGGPQGQIGQWFSYRWNFHLMAANDYVIVAPNRRGLPGFGREWNDQISKDWGGQCMKDILSATDSMVKEPFVDKDHTAAIGASFGGYTVYWLMGHHEDRFQTMIAHCGVFNLESMYGSTEELFFVNWDLGGPYWKGGKIAEDYKNFSPHQFVKNWKTPLMVIHGEKDFRVPVTQGMEAFTAAQVQGIPSRFLYFPKEGHWVMGPQNGVVWHRQFFDWLNKYCKTDES